MKLNESQNFLNLLARHGLTYDEFIFYVNIIKERKKKESSTDLETSPQQPYYSSYGKKTTYSIPSPFVNPTKIALADLWNQVGNLDQFLLKELKYSTIDKLNLAFTDVQKDAIGLWIRNRSIE
ncbi:MAG: hypothetical protein KDK36_07320 [Leptospiraceae bacterium]|nr:hypothetical protein [Leptospiraceae bacterium]